MTTSPASASSPSRHRDARPALESARGPSMSRRSQTLLPVLVLLLGCVPPALAQSSTGAQLLPGMGSYSHPIRTSSREAQQYFDQGLALLYNFNHAEAERSFL